MNPDRLDQLEARLSCARIHCQISMARINAKAGPARSARLGSVRAGSIPRFSKCSTGPAIESCISGKVYYDCH